MLVRCDRFAHAALILDGDAEVEPVQADARVHTQREPVAALDRREHARRLPAIMLIVHHPAEVVVRIREIRPTRDRTLVRGPGPGRIRCLERAALGVPGGRTGAAAEATPWSKLEAEKIAHVSTLTSPSDIRGFASVL